MDLTEAIEIAHKKRDLFKMDVHVLKDNEGKFFSVLSINSHLFLMFDQHVDKKIYYTAWNLTK